MDAHSYSPFTPIPVPVHALSHWEYHYGEATYDDALFSQG